MAGCSPCIQGLIDIARERMEATGDPLTKEYYRGVINGIETCCKIDVCIGFSFSRQSTKAPEESPPFGPPPGPPGN